MRVHSNLRCHVVPDRLPDGNGNMILLHFANNSIAKRRVSNEVSFFERDGRVPQRNRGDKIAN